MQLHAILCHCGGLESGGDHSEATELLYFLLLKVTGVSIAHRLATAASSLQFTVNSGWQSFNIGNFMYFTFIKGLVLSFASVSIMEI